MDAQEDRSDTRDENEVLNAFRTVERARERGGERERPSATVKVGFHAGGHDHHAR